MSDREKNKALDERVFAAVRDGCTRAAQIIEKLGEDMRAVDRSCQRLKRAERITYNSKRGWTVKKGSPR